MACIGVNIARAGQGIKVLVDTIITPLKANVGVNGGIDVQISKLYDPLIAKVSCSHQGLKVKCNLVADESVDKPFRVKVTSASDRIKANVEPLLQPIRAVVDINDQMCVLVNLLNRPMVVGANFHHENLRVHCGLICSVAKVVVISCFGGGYWINTLSWNDEDGWKNSI